MSRFQWIQVIVGMAMLCLPFIGCRADTAARQPYGLLVVPPMARGMPVSAEVDFQQLAAALGMKNWTGPVKPEDVRAAMDDRPTKGIPCQFDARGPAQGTVTILAPATKTSQRVRLYFAGGGQATPPSEGQLKVTRANGAVVVDNGYVRVTFDPRKQGGLPSRWEFLATGKVFENFNNNDAVFKPEIGRLHLRNDPQARVELVAAGPLRALVRVMARYVREDGTPPASNPRAVYEYSFFAGSPFIVLNARVSQDTPFDWNELHIVEINFPGEDFTHWAHVGGTQPLKAEKKSHSCQEWGALADGPEGPNVIAIMGRPLIYDGRGEYGTYIHGPWFNWVSKEIQRDVILYASGDPQALHWLREGLVPPRVMRARVSTPALEKALDKLSAATGPDGPRWRWAGALLAEFSRHHLPLAQPLAESAVKFVARKQSAAAWLAKSLPGTVCLDNGVLGLAWRTGEGGVGRITSLFDLRAGRELLNPDGPPLWSLSLEDADGKTITADALSPTSAVKADTQAKKLTVQWHPLRSEEAQAQVKDSLVITMTADLARNGALRLLASVKNDSPLTIAELTWPQLVFGPLGGEVWDDVFVAALDAGVMWTNPYETFQGIGGSLYPNGWLDIPLMTLYDKQGGLVFMAQDPYGSQKYIEAAGDPSRQAVRMAFRWPAPGHTVAGNDLTPSGRVEIAPLAAGQDWYDAAMVYRAWAEREAQWWPARGKSGRPDTPEWMLDLPVWALGGGAPSDCVAAVKAFREYMGVPCGFHWYNWHQIPFDVNYPHYFPVKEGFAEGVRELQAAGVRVMPYINGRLWDTGNDDFATLAFPAAAKKRDGTNYIEEYGSGAKLAPMCPTTQLWQETVQGIVKRLVGPEYGVDGVYIDQVAAAAPAPCYDKSHGHPLGGGHWWTTQGYWPMLQKLRADLAREFPGKMLTTECTAEPYLHCFDGYLSWHWQDDNAVPLFPAIYGDKIRLFSRAYGAAGDVDLVHRMKMAQQFVFGEQLGWIDPNVIKEEKAGPYLRSLAQTRWRLREYFRGRMMRPPVVEGDVERIQGDWQWGGVRMVTLAAVQAGAFRAEDGRVAVVVTNFSDNPQAFTLRLHVKEWKVKGRERVAMKLEGLETRVLELQPAGG
ncbi:MAG: DUF6259 domain-containing protein [Armatimonadetes bacterium]|nr:DUF6259 domain-containing protein [Armatimonadota bacterium]